MNKKVPSINSIWTSSNSDRFKVTDLQETEAGQFIYYTRLSDNTVYSCLVEAFLNRFVEHVN